MIAAGGLKLQGQGACVAAWFPAGTPGLRAGILAPLARERLNLTLLAHLGGGQDHGQGSVFCTGQTEGAQSHALLSARHDPAAFRLMPRTCIVSIFPHDQRPEVTGAFLASLGRSGVLIRGVASSPAAVAAVIAESARRQAIAGLFRDFTFRTFRTAEEFFQASQPREQDVREVVASYQEKAPRVYCLVRQEDLDFWEVAAPSPKALYTVGEFLADLGEQGHRLPFFAALPGPGKQLLIAFCLSPAAAPLLEGLEAAVSVLRRPAAAAFFTHGPHFGDRYGIALVLAAALEDAGVPLLALNCAVSSLSAVVPQEWAAAAHQALEAVFGAPHHA
jgi:hypothetical protein